MGQTTDTARTIVTALVEAHSAGRAPDAIILDETTQEALQRMGLGYWSAGRSTWSLFNVPVVIDLAPGWRLRFSSEPNTAFSTERPPLRHGLPLRVHLHDPHASQ